MKLDDINRILKLKQFDWLKIYIGFNTNKRKNAVNSSKKDFLKLVNNSVYGKTMESSRKKKKLDWLKNERSVQKKIISEFVGLKSKMYSLINVNNEESKKAKALLKT